jgi:membrane-associated phospholipid phosphatase
MALIRTDRLLLGYALLASMVILARRWVLLPGPRWVLLMHVLLGLLVWLFGRLKEDHKLGQFLHDIYPLIMLLPFYGAIGILTEPLGWERVLANDRVVQRWEEVLFGGQPSYQWIRSSPSVFWSGVLHLAYFSYYFIVLLGPLVLLSRGRRSQAHDFIFRCMLAFVMCYAVFILFPVAGPYYAFPSPEGPVIEVWSAKLVYRLLESGSSFGAAFPSSHVAATVAVTLGVWHYQRNLSLGFAPLAILLTIGTVYCQMHYAVDAIAGMLFGVVAWALGGRIGNSGLAVVPFQKASAQEPLAPG